MCDKNNKRSIHELTEIVDDNERYERYGSHYKTINSSKEFLRNMDESKNSQNQLKGILKSNDGLNKPQDINNTSKNNKSADHIKDESKSDTESSPIYVYTTPPVIITQLDNIEGSETQQDFDQRIINAVYKVKHFSNKCSIPNTEYHLIPTNLKDNCAATPTSKTSINCVKETESKALPDSDSDLSRYNVNNCEKGSNVPNNMIIASVTTKNASPLIFSGLNSNIQTLIAKENLKKSSMDSVSLDSDVSENTKNNDNKHSDTPKTESNSCYNTTPEKLPEIKSDDDSNLAPPTTKKMEEKSYKETKSEKSDLTTENTTKTATDSTKTQSVFQSKYESWMQNYMVRLLKRCNEQDEFISAIKNNVDLTPDERNTFLNVFLEEEGNIPHEKETTKQKLTFKEKFKKTFGKKNKHNEEPMSTREILDHYEVSRVPEDLSEKVYNEMHAYFDIYVRDYLFTWNRWMLLHFNHIHKDHVKWMEYVLSTEKLNDEHKEAIVRYLNGNALPLEKLLQDDRKKKKT